MRKASAQRVIYWPQQQQQIYVYSRLTTGLTPATTAAPAPAPVPASENRINQMKLTQSAQQANRVFNFYKPQRRNLQQTHTHTHTTPNHTLFTL